MANVTEAYAVFDSNDGSLTFFRDEEGKYENEQVIGTKTYYTGVESTGTTSSTVPWYSQRRNVTSVVFEDVIKPVQTSYWFYQFENLTSIIGIEKLDISNVTHVGSMFFGCQNLTTLDLSHFNTSKVTYMGYMFHQCRNLTMLDVSHFDTSKVTSMYGMFFACENLTATLNIMNMPTSYTNMVYGASVQSGAKITLKYIDPVTSADVDVLLATKSAESNVVNGGQGEFVPPIPPITDEDKYLPKTLFNRVFSKVKEYVDTLCSGKQDSLFASNGIKIENDTISGTKIDVSKGTTNFAEVVDVNGSKLGVEFGEDVVLSASSPILFGESVALQKKLTAGDGIKIENNTISADEEVFVAVYEQTPYTDVKDAIDANKVIVLNMPANHNQFCMTFSTYTNGGNALMYAIFKMNNRMTLTTVTLTPENRWTTSHTDLQDKLVSGMNIKTVNNQSLLGSGDINVSDIFVAERNVTPYEDILEAINAGKLICFSHNGFTLVPSSVKAMYVEPEAYIILRITQDLGPSGRPRIAFVEYRITQGVTQDAGWTVTPIEELQARLQAGINIKTINNQSLLGSGNIDIQGGGGDVFVSVFEDSNVYSVSVGNQTDGTVITFNEAKSDGRVSGYLFTDTPFEMAKQDELEELQIQLGTLTDLTTTSKTNLVGAINEINAKDVGVNFEIGVEKWYGTYKEDGVTYQVYSKVIKIDALPSVAGITNYPHGIIGIKQILCVYGFGTNGFVLNAPRQNAQDNIAIYQVQKSTGGSVAIEVGKDRSNMGAYVCLIYAKNN